MNRPALETLAFIPLWLYVCSLPSEKSIAISGIGTATKLFGALSIGALVFLIASHARLRLPSPAHFASLAFVAWSAATYCWTESQAGTMEQIGTYVNLFAVLWLTWEVATTRSRLLLLFDAYVIGTAVPAWDTLQRFLSGKQSFYLRYASAGFDPNDLALTLALSLPISYYLSITRGGNLRWLYRLQILTVIGTIFLTGSRGGTVSMAIGLSLVLTTMRLLNARQRALLAVSAIVVLAVAVAIVPASSFSRIATLGSEIKQGTLNSRTLLWEGGWDAFKQVPFQGIGSGAYPEIMSWIVGRVWGFDAVAHNSFLSVLVETGLIGFAIFAAWLSLMAAAAFRMPWFERRLWITTLILWAVGVSSLTWEYRKPTWMFFALLTAHAAVVSPVTRPAPGEHNTPAPIVGAWKGGLA